MNEQDDKGQVLTHISHLSARPLKTAEGYSLDEEDAAIYSDAEDFNHFSHGREWPDKILKKKAAQSQAPLSDETIKSLLQVHHIHVYILAALGVDACREYRLPKVEKCWPGLLQAQASVIFVALAATTLRRSKSH